MTAIWRANKPVTVLCLTMTDGGAAEVDRSFRAFPVYKDGFDVRRLWQEISTFAQEKNYPSLRVEVLDWQTGDLARGVIIPNCAGNFTPPIGVTLRLLLRE